jgi:hypothetical protein
MAIGNQSDKPWGERLKHAEIMGRRNRSMTSIYAIGLIALLYDPAYNVLRDHNIHAPLLLGTITFAIIIFLIERANRVLVQRAARG